MLFDSLNLAPSEGIPIFSRESTSMQQEFHIRSIDTTNMCFTQAKITSLCLKAVYERCHYKDLLNLGEEYESLGSYCKRINPTLISEDGKSLLPNDFHLYFSSLLVRLENTDYQNFVLTNSEKGMLNYVLDLVPPAGIPAENETSTNMYHKYYFYPNGTRVKENINFSRICAFCHGKCSNFLLLYPSEIIGNIQSRTFRNVL
ncbi:hypothetical protein HNY73_008748 [Argiope bruennichi]|uniref:Uncharacterized protein n=1 Tax=Argiope bruennichi TaxID=94029 RepID=A0A8T0FCS5_ARGBR|nr:hypothetical protein HNY73_008748 [Argiope bruennichi]